MRFPQPLHSSAYPETAKAEGAFDVGASVEGAITGKNPAWSKNSGHLPKRGAFISDEVDRVTEEHRIGIVDERGKIAGFSPQEIGLHPQHFDALLRAPERVC